MTKKEYLELKEQEDKILSKTDAMTSWSDGLAKKLLAIEGEVADFEHTNFHKGYSKISIELENETLVSLIRMARELRMPLSDMVALAIWSQAELDTDFSWVTEIFELSPEQKKESTEPVPEAVRQRLGWGAGDFLRVTASKEGLRIRKVDIE